MTQTRTRLLEDLDSMLRKVTAQSVLLSEKIATCAGIDATGLECLDLLRLEGPMTPGRLASVTGLTTGAVTMLVDRLQRAGFVRRVPNPDDRRSVLVEALPAAARVLEPLFTSLAEAMARVNRRYDNAALRLVLDYLTRAHEAGAEHLARLDRASLQRPSTRRREASR